MTSLRIALFTGAALGDDPRWVDDVTVVTRTLAEAGHAVVYGGGRSGLMGVVADTALQAGAEVFGVIPQNLVDAELAHPGLTDLAVVPDMGARKAQMTLLSDAMVALPGGAGTLEEFFDVWVGQVLGNHRKPVALYSPAGFWDPLIAALDDLVAKGFMKPKARAGLIVASTPEELLEGLAHWAPPAPRWADRTGPHSDSVTNPMRQSASS